MTRATRRLSVDDVAKLTGELTDQLKVLVTAVDDLRCEVEWWARNAADERAGAPAGTGCSHPTADRGAGDDAPRSDEGTCHRDAKSLMVQGSADNSTQAEVSTAAQLLRSLERNWSHGRPSPWHDAFASEDCPEFPVGQVVALDEAMWTSVLDIRPAHVVEHGCCCEEGIGAPYLLAWINEDGCFVRELAEAQAIELQRACLAAQAEAKAHLPKPTDSRTQLGLW